MIFKVDLILLGRRSKEKWNSCNCNAHR